MSLIVPTQQCVEVSILVDRHSGKPLAVFGGAVAVSGDLVIVEAPAFSYQQEGEGIAVVFDCADRSACVQVATLLSSDRFIGNLFGVALAISPHGWWPWEALGWSMCLIVRNLRVVREFRI